MAGTIPISMTQQFDVMGKPLSGGQLYIIQAGTVSTPQDAFVDLALTIKQPYPMTLDAAGRVPQFFLADGTVKIRLQDKSGVVQLAADQVLVIGPSSGGGSGGGAVDATQLIQTGFMTLRHGIGPLAGFVRANNLTIGSAASGATERANADCQALFQYLWTDGSLAISGGRGATAIADWTANKNIATPDWRGYAVAGLDDMGNTPANRLGGLFANPTTLGSAGGAPSMTILTTNLPPYTPGGTVTNGAIHSSVSPGANILSSSGLVQVGGGGSFFSYNLNNLTVSSPQDPSSFNGTPQGGSSVPFSIISPRKLCTVYLKL